MCGIAGIFRRDQAPIQRPVLGAMTDALAHRGPDDRGLWISDCIGLGHRRLSIRDLSAAGQQPMCDEQKQVYVTYNGELYGEGALRAELEKKHGATFRTSCDAEILPYAYLAWGEEMFDRLEGMFALAVWDVDRQQLLLARDRIGIKPIYYYSDSDKVLFASELKGLLMHPELPRRIDPENLHTFLAAGHCGPRRSLLTGVSQVPPGTVLRFTLDGGEARREYWCPHRTGVITDLNEAVDELETLLIETVESTLASDVPVGVLQSGGIDSSLVTLSLKHRADVPLFTACSAEPTHDESAGAAAIAATVGNPHHLIQMDEAPDPSDTLRSVVHHFDGQCADTGAFGFYRLAGEVRKHITVVLSGDGGDEFFGGYDTYRASRAAHALAGFFPRTFAGRLGQFAYRLAARDERRLPAATAAYRFACGFAAGGPTAHVQWRRLVPAFWPDKLYGRLLAPYASTSPFAEYECYLETDHGDFIDNCLLADQRFHLQSVLAKVDAMSMAHGLEVRVPLLERRIMEFAGQCATELLTPRIGSGKRLLREVARKIGAPRAITEAEKHGFNVPIARLLRSSLLPVADQYLDKEADRLEPWLRPDVVRSLWEAHKMQRANHAFGLWPILTYGIWLAEL